MPSQFGGIEIDLEEPQTSKFGGIPVDGPEEPRSGGGSPEDQTYLEQADPISNWEKVKRFLSKHDDPSRIEKEGARAVQALVDSEVSKKLSKDGKFLTPSMAYKYRAMIDKGKEVNPTMAAVTSDWETRVKQSWDTGVKQKEMGAHGADFILTGSEKSKELLQSIKTPSQDEEYISESLLEDSVRSAAKMVPIMADIGIKSAVGAVKMGSEFGLIATILGNAGPQALFMEEAVTVPAAIAVGIKTGAFITAWKESFKVEGGLAVSDLLDFQDKEGNKIDENIVRLSAAAIGGVNAFIEVAQLKGILNTIPVFNKLSKKAVKEIITGETVKAKLLDLSARYGGTLTKETFQEVLQEVTNVIFEEGAKKVSEDTGGAVIDRATWGKVADRLTHTAVDAVKGFAVIAAPGTVKGGYNIVRDAKKGDAPGTVEGDAPGKPKKEVPLDTRTPQEKAVDKIIDTSFDRVTSMEETDIDAEIDKIIADIEKDESTEIGPKAQAFKDQISQVVEENEVEAVTSILDARAKAVGMTTDEYIDYHGLEIVTGGDNAGGLYQADDQKTVIEEDGVYFETGVPVTFDFVHNTESATGMFGIPDENSKFGRGFEPSGKFVTRVKDKNKALNLDTLESGTITFQNPLVILNDNLEWKKKLSSNYGGLKGKELSKAIIADGFDGIVTVDESSNGTTKYVSEIVDFTSFDESKALYQKEETVKTPEFKSWFGKSKVVDSEGQPLVVYHGSPNEFTEFSYDFTGQQGRSEGAGFYFTDDKGTAEGYGKGGTVFEVYLNIKKPMNVNTPAFDEDVWVDILQRTAEIEHEYDPEVSIDDGFLANFGGLYGAVDLT